MSNNVNAYGPFDPAAGLADKRLPILDVARMCANKLSIRVPTSNKTKSSPKQALKFGWVPIEKIYINYNRQRWPEPRHMAKLYRKWDLNCVTPLQCRYDPDEDRYYAADGQQHMLVWVLTYGKEEIPCFYVESTDPNVETQMLLALNTDSKPMGKYFIHKQHCMVNDHKALEIENAVIAANCFTAYASKKTPGSITHISHLYEASEDYGNNALTWALTTYRKYWSNEKVEMVTILGMLKLRAVLIDNNQFTDQLFGNIMYECASRFDSGCDLHKSIHYAFTQQYPDGYKGLGHREQVASGMISLYEQGDDARPVHIKKPLEITVPVIKNTVPMADFEEEDVE